MIEEPQRVRIEEADWSALFPFVSLFRSFRMAWRGSRILMSAALLVVLWLGGHAVDAAFGPRVYRGEIAQYGSLSADGFADWIDLLEGSGMKRLGVFETAQAYTVDSLEMLVNAAVGLRFGFADLLHLNPYPGSSVVGAIRNLLVTLPGWLVRCHPGFLAIYGLGALVVVAWLGGMISRSVALQATAGRRASVREAARFTRSRWVWFTLAPLMPVILMGIVSAVPILAGLVFFNLPGLDVVGGVLYFIPLLCGLVMVGLAVLTAAAGPMLYPAIAVEGTDGFDAISRAFSYVIGRPWQWLFYNLIAVVYGAVTYLLVTAVIFSTLWITHRCVGLLATSEVGPGLTRFEAILSPPRYGLGPQVGGWSQLCVMGKTTSSFTVFWAGVASALAGAYAVSYFFAVNTWVYLLLRRSADKTEFDDIWIDEAASDLAEDTGKPDDPPAPQS